MKMARLVVLILLLGLGCKRSTSTPPQQIALQQDATQAAPVDASVVVTARDATNGQSAVGSGSNAQATEEARGLVLSPAEDVDDAATHRNPAQDLNRQVGDSIAAAKNSAPNGARVTVASHRALDRSSLSSSRLSMEFLRRYVSSVKKCYGDVLSTDANASGQMTLKFTVSETGSVLDGDASSWNAGLTACVREAMAKWTFSFPMENNAAVRARFELALKLESDKSR
jgi:hypothetical protein